MSQSKNDNLHLQFRDERIRRLEFQVQKLQMEIMIQQERYRKTLLRIRNPYVIALGRIGWFFTGVTVASLVVLIFQ